MTLEHLWATWRSEYVGGLRDGALGDQEAEGSLFERILGAEGSDIDKHIVARGEHCFVLLNRYPYTAGHSLVLPNRAAVHLDSLDHAVHRELWEFVRATVTVTRDALGSDAVNVGLNLGEAAGGSQSDHLHVHVVPRWHGDANFMSVTADTRVLPMSLDEVAQRIAAAWPRHLD